MCYKVFIITNFGTKHPCGGTKRPNLGTKRFLELQQGQRRPPTCWA